MIDHFPIDQESFQKYRESIDLSTFPKGFLKTFEGMSDDDKTRWFEMRYRCLKYPLFLSGFVPKTKTGDEHLSPEYVPILGMDFQKNPHSLLFDEFLHFRPGDNVVLSDLDSQYKKRMILWSRGLFKTSSIIVDIIGTILNYPNVRICFLTGSDPLAKRQLSRVKRFFEKPTQRFKFLFPEYCLRSVCNKKMATKAAQLSSRGDTEGAAAVLANAWTDELCRMGTAHEFTVPARTNDTFAEPTFAISTAKSVKAGSHFDIIFIDDLVNEANYRSTKLLEKVYQDYIDLCPLLEPTGFIIMTGTRYSFGDTYERIQEAAREEERLLGRTIWKFSIRDCWSMGCKHCPHTDVYHNRDINILQPPCGVEGCHCPGFVSNGSKGVLFPQTRTRDGRSIGHTLEFLEGEKIRLGEEFFANQYENRPIASGAQTFTETLIGAATLHELSQIPSYNQSFTFIVGDLAYVGQPGRDASVLYICRKFQGQLFIFDCMAGNWNSGTVAENTVNILLKHRPGALYYEKFNGWEAYNTIISAKAAERGIQKVPIEWLPLSQAPNAKTARIGSSHGLFVAKRIWLYAGMPEYQTLVNQLVKWPKLGRHDDFADCLGMVAAAPTGYQLENPPVVESSSNWLRKLHQSDPVDDSYGDNGCGTGICC